MNAFKVPVYESEKGWGSKLDDFMVCLTRTDAEHFITEFNSKNDKEVVPDWYMYATNDIVECELTDAQLKVVKKHNRYWFKGL